MSREIKFRAWLKDAKQMVEVRNVSFFEGVTTVKIYDEPMNIEVWFDLEELELLQFTGLKDMNGIEIYEGDVIGKESCQNYYVSFESGMFVGVSTNKIQAINIRPWKLKRMIDSGYAKIGNIYENKNLLEEK